MLYIKATFLVLCILLAHLGPHHALPGPRGEEEAGDGDRVDVRVGRRNHNSGGPVNLQQTQFTLIIYRLLKNDHDGYLANIIIHINCWVGLD